MKTQILEVGDEVYWNDPDDGLTSAYYHIVRFINDDVVYLENGVSECEALLHELSRFDLLDK